MAQDRRISLKLAFVLLGTAGALIGRALPDPPARSLETIQQQEIRMHLEFLSSPEVGGRYSLSPGLKVVNRYLASRLAFYGFEGGADGDFLQTYTVRSAQAVGETSFLNVTAGEVSGNFDYGDFILSEGPGGSIEGEVVFAGFGISAPELGHDDYASIEVAGKIVLTLPEGPRDLDTSRLRPSEKGTGAAQAHGAKAVLTLPSSRFKRFVRSPMFKKFAAERGQVDLYDPDREGLNGLTLTPDSAEPLLTLIGQTFDGVYEAIESGESFDPRKIEARVDFRVDLNEEIHRTANVAAILEGSDENLREEFIVISAHHDHLKTGENGVYYPGADDDASGVAAILAIARAFALNPPRRSILVMFHSGEENGLLGSRFNTEVSPAVPLGQIVANLNVDMIGRSRPEGDQNSANRHLTNSNSVHVIGADRISEELHSLNEQTNTDFEQLDFDYTYNDPKRPERFYYRSDHWNYAKNGIPVAFFFTGTHQDYHRPTDTVDKIDFQKLTRIARHVYSLGWRLANLEDRVKID